MKLLTASLVLAALPALAQLPTPNKAGVSAGHDVLRSKDAAAANKFFQALGAHPDPFAGTNTINVFPSLLIFVTGGGGGRGKQNSNPAPPPELLGSEGSVLDFMGFSVKDLKGSLADWAKAGITPEPGGTATQVFIMSPDKIKIRVRENKSLATPIQADTVKMMVPNVAEAQAWYAKNFGAEMIRRNGEMVADIPGSNILFEQAKGTVAPSAGRAFDRIGLEVVGLEAFAKKLEANGVKFANPYRYTDSMKAGFAVFVDPFGTQIELSEGLTQFK